MKLIYAVLFIACAIGFSSCDIESNASYTGNFYSSNARVHKQHATKKQAETTQQQGATAAVYQRGRSTASN